MKRKIFLSLFVLLTLCIITGCGKNKEENGNYKINGSSSIYGAYELYEVKGDNVTYSRKEWIDMTTEDRILIMNKDKTASIINTYKDSTTGKTVRDEEKYTFDDNDFYGVESTDTKQGVKYYSYKYKDGIIELTVIDDSHGSIWVFKQK